MSYYAKDCELILGLVSPVGVNLDDVTNRLTDLFHQFNYDVNLIHLSKLADEYFDEGSKTFQSEAERLENSMCKGTELRTKYQRGDIYSLLAINKISSDRNEDENGNFERRKRTVHIIRSLKHAEEVETLRTTYGNGFFLLGISATTETKKHFLRQLKGVTNEEELERLIARDDKEEEKFGQQTRNVFQLSDAFATTDDNNRLSNQLGRIIDLLFSHPTTTPTAEEYAMFMAYTASIRSADLSRQVGAVITNSQDDIISTGANDVPKFGGGLYWPSNADYRDHILGHDSNEDQRNAIIEDAALKVAEDDCTDEELTQIKNKLKKSRIKDLTEFGRAVHAEMEALLQAARNGVNVRNSKMYATTYPCHNCAKHIVASGVSEVIYIEPYPKSFAIDLYEDSIDNEGNSSEKVSFRQFVGIGPRKFIDLFSMNLSSGRKIKRKNNGCVVSWERGDAELRIPMSPLSYLENEAALVKELDDCEGKQNE